MGNIVIKNEFNLLGGIQPILYGTNEYHKLLSDDNIGENGENLTIVVLSCERANATIGMMESIRKNIPNFKGKYLIADNGSSKETIEKLKATFEQMPYECEIIEFGENLGVAKGRNKAVEYVKTEWFMSLDNDILFACNILPEIRNTISQLGCNFVNLPLLNATGDELFAAGGNIFIEQISNGIHIGCGGAFEQTKCTTNQTIPRSLSTFMFGGASVIRKSTFEECGKFDEGMFVGFEDIDFSITIFKKGYKIGTIGILGLIHDHKKPESQSDLEYERQRFSNVRLLKSAMYFENKHNFKIWNEGTEAWLKQREKELGIVSSEKEEKVTHIKKKIAIIVDKKESEIDAKAEKIKEQIKNQCEIKNIYLDVINNNIMSLIFSLQNIEKIYFADETLIKKLDLKQFDNYIQKYGVNKQNFLNNYVSILNFIVKSNESFEFLDNMINSIKDDNEIITALME